MEASRNPVQPGPIQPVPSPPRISADPTGSPPSAERQDRPGPTFGFSATELRDRYDRRLKQDGDSGVRSCDVVGNLHRCTFDDTSFQRSVDAFKKLDLVNGSFGLNASFSLGVSADRVARIVVRGDRSDPINLFAYIGKIESLLKTLDPTLAEDQVTAMLTDGLGLARGDDDPSIGRDRVEIRSAYMATCRQALSRVSTAITCTFVPRS